MVPSAALQAQLALSEAPPVESVRRYKDEGGSLVRREKRRQGEI